MRTPIRAFVTIGLLVAACPFAAVADTIHMKDGTKLEGKVIREGDKALVIETQDLGAIPVAKNDIERIEKAGDAEAAEDAPEGETPAAEADGEAKVDPAADGEGEGAEKSDEPEPTTAAARMNKRFAARIVRTTRAAKPKDTPKAGDRPGVAKPDGARPVAVEKNGEPEEVDEATIGGQALSQMEPGSRVIVFQPPERFGPAREVISIGKRIAATLEVAGTATAYLGVERADGKERIPLRLADVKRHVEIKSPSSYARMIEGVAAGDWVRIVTRDGQRIEGRLRGYAGGGLEILEQDSEDGSGTAPDKAQDPAPEGPGDGEAPAEPDAPKAPAGRRIVKVQDIVELDGFFKNKRVAGALQQVKEDEPISVVLWPTGKEILGRFLAVEKGRILIDVDSDGAPDEEVRQHGPIAQIRRAPARVRSELIHYREGDWIKVHTNELFDDARVDRTFRGKILGLTAHAVCLEEGGGARVVAWDRALGVAKLNSPEKNRLRKRGRTVDASKVRSDVSILPGAPASEASTVDEASGVSVIAAGPEVSHVFVAAPFDGNVFGVRIGEKAKDASDDSELDFDTVVVPKGEGSTEMISDTLAGLRLTMLVDTTGKISAVEISKR